MRLIKYEKKTAGAKRNELHTVLITGQSEFISWFFVYYLYPTPPSPPPRFEQCAFRTPLCYIILLLLCGGGGRRYCVSSNEIIWRRAPRASHIFTDWRALTNSQLSKSGFESNSVTGLHYLYAVFHAEEIEKLCYTF